MLGYRHSGFTIDAGASIEAHEHADLERLLRYCDLTLFAMAHLPKAGGELVYCCTNQHNDPGSNPNNKCDGKVNKITLTHMELIDRIAALAPLPRSHRHRYYGVLAPNLPHRVSVTALAAATQTALVLRSPTRLGHARFLAAASAQTADFNGVKLPRTLPYLTSCACISYLSLYLRVCLHNDSFRDGVFDREIFATLKFPKEMTWQRRFKPQK